MAEKDIILRINTITDKEVMEEYGEVLDKVLGSYDDNIRTLQSYRDLVKSLRADISAYNKVIAEQGDLTEEQAADYEKLIKMERSYSNEISKLQIVLKNQEKINQSLDGSMENQSLLLGKLRMAWRKMTDEQKAANPQMLATIQALDKQLKGADASIGNFQRNVGNYPQILQQILPVQSQVGQGLMQLAQNAGASTGAIGALGVGLGAAVGAYKLFQQAQELTQTVGDAVAIKVAGWEAVYEKFIRTIVSADFSNFWEQLRRVKEVGEETAAVLDELFERNNALTIAESKASVVQQRNLMIMRDQTKSIKERKEAGEAYMASVMEIANVRKDIAEQEFGAKLTNFATQTRMSEEDAKFYIENYNKYREAANKYAEEEKKAIDFADARRKALRENLQADADNAEANRQAQIEANRQMYNSMTADEQRFITLSSKYNNANDALTADLVQAWAKVEGAIANALQSSQRAATTVNSLTAQQQRKTQIDTSKVGLIKEQKSNTKIKVDGLFEEFEREADAEWGGFAEVQAGNMVKAAEIAIDDFIEEMEAEPAIVLDRIKQSPFAKALGVTDEQLTSIKSQAMQAAQQIYGSIQQAAQEASQRRLDNELKAVETEAEREKAILKAKLDSGVLNEKQYEKKIAEIDKQAEARREEAQKEAFEREKRWNILTAIMNTAMGVTAALKQLPSPKAWIEAALVTATGAAQVATISAQKFARGGELHGASHAQGGIKGNIQGHNIELEGDEVVINKRSSRKYRSLLSYINSDNGWGVDFAGVRGSGGYRPQLKYARGGVLGSYDFSPASVPQASILQKQMERQVEQTESLIAATNRRIDRLQVQVNISDIEGASNTKRVHINRAKL